jgi:hypothetical protein
VVPFQPWHAIWLTLQRSQQDLASTLTLEYGHSLRLSGPCYTAFAGGTVIACAGVVEIWKGRAQVWSLLSDQFPVYRKAIHKAVKTFLRDYRMRRLECVIDPNNPAARRWAEHLGFEFEGYMYGYTPNGETQMMLVRLED